MVHGIFLPLSIQVVWFTALFPYVVLAILMVRGATLEGAGKGVEYYLTPNFTRLASSSVSFLPLKTD